MKMKKELAAQIAQLEKYGISNYTIENGLITINGKLDLSGLTSADKDFLQGATINGDLDLCGLTSAKEGFLQGTIINGDLNLMGLKSVDKDFLQGTTIKGYLSLSRLKSVDKDFLKGTTIKGELYLDSLTSAKEGFLQGATINDYLDLRRLRSADKDFLQGATINGSLNLSGLESADKDIIESNVKKLTEGYNKEGGYCFFDDILSKVLAVRQRNGYTFYKTPFEFIAEKDNKTAHGKTIKKAIADLEFKFFAEKLEKEPIKEDTLITVKYYRLLTGACDSGIADWMRKNGLGFKWEGNVLVEDKAIPAKDLLPILEKSNAYGLKQFKSLITF